MPLFPIQISFRTVTSCSDCKYIGHWQREMSTHASWKIMSFSGKSSSDKPSSLSLRKAESFKLSPIGNRASSMRSRGLSELSVQSLAWELCGVAVVWISLSVVERTSIAVEDTPCEASELVSDMSWLLEHNNIYMFSYWYIHFGTFIFIFWLSRPEVYANFTLID